MVAGTNVCGTVPRMFSARSAFGVRRNGCARVLGKLVDGLVEGKDIPKNLRDFVRAED